MNIRFTFCVLLLISKICFSQTKIDTVISIKFPGKVELIKKKKKDTFIKSYHFNDSNDSFTFIKSLQLNKDGTEIKVYNKNSKMLIDKYKYVSKILIDRFEKMNFKFSDSTLVSINGFKAYKLCFKDKSKKNKTVESLIIDLNGILYYGVYRSINKFDEKRKNDFFNSLKIEEPEKQKQIVKPSLIDIFLEIIGLKGEATN